jgi:hypothetical protein
MHPAMAAAVEEELKRRVIWDAELARREADHEDTVISSCPGGDLLSP